MEDLNCDNTWIQRPFTIAFFDAFAMVELARSCCDEQRALCSSASRSAIANCAFALEAAANGGLEATILRKGFKKDLDKMPWLSKFEMLAMVRGVSESFQPGIVIVERVSEIFRLRNRLVHGKKSESTAEVVAASDRATHFQTEKKTTNKLDISLLPSLWGVEDSEKSFKATVEFLNYFFSSVSGLSRLEAQRFLCSEMRTGEKNLMMMDAEHQQALSRIRQEWKLSVEFLQ